METPASLYAHGLDFARTINSEKEGAQDLAKLGQESKSALQASKNPINPTLLVSERPSATAEISAMRTPQDPPHHLLSKEGAEVVHEIEETPAQLNWFKKLFSSAKTRLMKMGEKQYLQYMEDQLFQYAPETLSKEAHEEANYRSLNFVTKD
ncbi:hypothetical protein PCASD_20402 [Puccinia coronata f. sp. avenae]|uniref:Uncharacterized protein n=1 Tax=Puccinia coronata f. sp. avenae TaxID=200324 RepID=A0A2N5SMU7_9BASI|nr:hypothetical protein PCASD_20402 [Puccinia coronata f. sp. avenae]